MKKAIRNEILSKRKALSEEEVLSKSLHIFHRLKALSLYEDARNVMVYMDFRNEVKTHMILEDLISSDKNVLIPISLPDTKGILLSQVLEPRVELVEGTYGILEPKEEYIRPVDPQVLDLIIVPGVAFDKKGYRVGYGGGYYDRFLDKLTKEIPSIALAFDLQMVDQVPKDVFDYPVDYIITETETIHCHSFR